MSWKFKGSNNPGLMILRSFLTVDIPLIRDEVLTRCCEMGVVRLEARWMITAGPAEVRRSVVIFPGVLTKAATNFQEFTHLPSRSELIYYCCWKCKSTRQIGRREVLAPRSSHLCSLLTSHQSSTHWHMATLIGCNQSALTVKPAAIQEDDHVANPPLSDTADVYPFGSCGCDLRC